MATKKRGNGSMNLISCDNCGIVLDKDKYIFPEDIYNDEGSVRLELAQWNGDSFVAYIHCPVCDAPILEED